MKTERRKAVAYDSFINKTIRVKTTRLYNVPIPYAHLQVVRATRNPKTNGERWGAKTTPILHILIYDTIGMSNLFYRNFDIPSWLANEMGTDRWRYTGPMIQCISHENYVKLRSYSNLGTGARIVRQSVIIQYAIISNKHTRRKQWDTAML